MDVQIIVTRFGQFLVAGVALLTAFGYVVPAEWVEGINAKLAVIGVAVAAFLPAVKMVVAAIADFFNSDQA